MPIPGLHSIYRFCSAIKDANGVPYLTDAPPFLYDASIADTIEHVVVTGDTWHSIAAQHYGAAIPDAELLYKVIADFQPEYVADPSLALEEGSIVYVPSLLTIDSLILNESRRPEYEG